MSMNLAAVSGIKSDINVTPLVDVMLVLLIIMMIVAPLLQQGVAVTLPLAANSTREAGDAGSDGRDHRQPTRTSIVNAMEVPDGQLQQPGQGDPREQVRQDRHHQGR